MQDSNKNKKSIYFFIAAFIVAIVIMEITSSDGNDKKKVASKTSTKETTQKDKRDLTKSPIYYKSEFSFKKKKNKNWKLDDDSCNDPGSLKLNKEWKYSPRFIINYAETLDLNDIKALKVGACFKQLGDNMNKVLFVVSLSDQDNKSVYWNKYQIQNTKKGEWVKNNARFKLGKIEKGKKYKLKVYVLNKEKNDFLLDNFKLEVIPK